MKVHYQVVRRGYREILQDIATQIPFLAPTTFRAIVSDLHQTNVTTEEGGFPEQGSHTADGTLFTGTYPYKKWINEYFSPYHEAICASRGTTEKKKDSPFQNQKRKAAELRSTIVELTAKKEHVMSDISVITDDIYGVGLLGISTYRLSTQAGRQFGGRSDNIDGKKE